jgi:starch synthase
VKVLSVASECFPLVKTGGLADVAGALPAALAREGVEMRVLLPGYPAVLAALAGEIVLERELFGGPVRVLAGEAAGLSLLAIDAPHLYARPGNPYTGPDGRDWPDNPQRFAALARIAADIGLGAAKNFVPDVLHAHDWQAGLTPAYLYYSGARAPGTVFTVHNLAFQGQVSATLLAGLGLPPESYGVDGVEYYGSIGMLKAGLRLADRITTVSPTYAAEIQTPEGGMGLDGLLRERSGALSGILNGIDVDVWNPAADPALAARFDASGLHLRGRNKLALQRRMRLAADPAALLLGVVGRLTEQKGMDLIPAALPALLARGAQLAVVGSGDPALQRSFEAAAEAHPGRVGVFVGYDEALAHLVQGGCDALLVPSRFEPCGLTQLCALRYGAVPVVSRVGGLADTVIDANVAALGSGAATGVQFSPVSAAGLAQAAARTAQLWAEPPLWRQTQLNGMRADFSWAAPARAYAALYRGLAGAA